MGQKLNLLGQRFVRLLVLKEAEPIGKKKQTAWHCICDCGKERIVITENLRNGDTKSCGCLNNEQRSARAKNMYAVITKYSPIESNAVKVWRSRYKEMPYENFLRLSQQNCYYCGAKPNNEGKEGNYYKSSSKERREAVFLYNGIDRIDNSKDHSDINNLVSCCKSCNYAKRDRTIDQFKEWATNLYNIFVLKGNDE